MTESMRWVAGVDEVGRGPLVGQVVAAAVVLDPLNPIEGLKDSKKLSEKRRNALYELICERAVGYAIASASVQEIDQLNILHASMLAMQRAVLALTCQVDRVLVDGNRCPVLPMPSEAIVGGDASHACISAASILAKVTRDRQMVALHQQYPGYGFDRHKGYPTREHLQALQRLGPLLEHRRSFRPVREILEGAN